MCRQWAEGCYCSTIETAVPCQVRLEFRRLAVNSESALAPMTMMQGRSKRRRRPDWHDVAGGQQPREIPFYLRLDAQDRATHPASCVSAATRIKSKGTKMIIPLPTDKISLKRSAFDVLPWNIPITLPTWRSQKMPLPEGWLAGAATLHGISGAGWKVQHFP